MGKQAGEDQGKITCSLKSAKIEIYEEILTPTSTCTGPEEGGNDKKPQKEIKMLT